MVLCVCPNPSIDKYVWVEGFIKGKANRSIREQFFPGGKGVHVAMGLIELGIEVELLGFWAGASGNWVKAACESMGITCHGPEITGDTRTCLTLKSNDEYNETEVLGVGPLVQPDDLKRFNEIYDQLLQKADIISCSGSWPPCTTEASYDLLVSKANELDKVIMVDCAGNTLIKTLKKKPFAVHMNRFEGFDIFKTLNPLEIVEKVGLSCSWAAITCGAEGLYLSDGRTMIHALSKVEHVISTVGCGDSLMSGLIAGYAHGLDLIDTARIAAACGAANCIREELGMFHKRDMELLRESCDINILNVN